MLAQHAPALSPGRRRPSAESALDFEALALAAGSSYEDAWRSERSTSSSYAHATCSSGGGSGLPLVCSNCGVSFFSLLVADDELECYCSGECKWSVVMYREMDRRVRALRRHLRAVAATKPSAAALKAPTAATAAAVDSPTGSTRSSTTWNSATSTDSDSYDSCSSLLDDVISCR